MAKKECPKCSSKLGVRTKVCPDCSHKFLIRKRRPKPKQIKNWRDLKKGDIIKCVSGTGPYFISKDKPGERIMMGHKGVFEVITLNYRNPKSCGIIGKPVKKNRNKANVQEYIYMGKIYHDDILNINKEPHKILGVETEAETIKPKSKKKKKKKHEEIEVDSLNQIIAESTPL
tara:strand:+ start:1104 stop:1622 length:519 start_codon:yes stop_codon:yes gene_type:complete